MLVLPSGAISRICSSLRKKSSPGPCPAGAAAEDEGIAKTPIQEGFHKQNVVTKKRGRETRRQRCRRSRRRRRSECEQLPEDQVPSATLFEPSGNLAVIVARILARESK
jgi:hypothetical protein